MKRIVTDKAPAALGPYVQAVDTGSTVYCSGQLGLDPVTNTLADGVAAQTRQSLKKPAGRSGGSRADPGRRGQDHRLCAGSGRFRHRQ